MDEEGGNIFSELMRYYKGIIMALKGVRSNFKPVVREILKNVGDKQIKTLMIVRTPLTEVLQFFVRRINKEARNLNHDKLFHLFIIAILNDGQKYTIEKNENINIKKYEYNKLDDYRQIPFNNKDLTINILLGKTLEKIGKEKFFRYDAFNENCQRFVLDVLTSNNINVQNDLKKFIIQDVHNIVPSWIERVIKTATDIINRSETIIEGEGIEIN